MNGNAQTTNERSTDRRLGWISAEPPRCRSGRPPLRKHQADRRKPQLETGEPRPLSDQALLELFRQQPQQAWKIFLDRYAERIIGQLRALSLDRDEAMDRFVFICERLAQNGFRRLRQVRKTGERGELVPWLRQVVKNAAIDWGWSQAGRRRLFRSVEDLGELEQRVFQLHFWAGLGPAAMVEALRIEGCTKIGSEQVFDALDKVLERLDAGQRWRLLSQLSDRHPTVGITKSPTAPSWEPATREPDPEAELLQVERTRLLEQALANLPSRDRLIFRLRYDDALSLPDIAAIASLGLTTVKASLRKSREALRKAVEEVAR